MDENKKTGTRILSLPSGAQVLSVRCARLKVVSGPDKGKELELGERTVASIGTDADADLVLTDDSVSRKHAELRAEPGGWVLRDLASTNGIRLAGVRLPEAVMDRDSPVLQLGETGVRLALSESEVQHQLSTREQFGSVLGRSIAMRQMFILLEKASATDSTVLLEGESGTGKEVIAESIHRASPRAKSPLVVVDCSTIPENLIESELFGHERGAFTGANAARPGAIEEANGGTLFLDEIGELPLEMQPKFLRALEKRQVKRIGSTEYKSINVRVVAATNRDLAKCVADGTFRSDLYFRLAVVKVTVPPLRHRLDDVEMLARLFVKHLRPNQDPAEILTGAALAAFTSYNWPGNVRELRNAVERLLALGELPAVLGAEHRVVARFGEYHAARRDALDRFEREYCSQILEESEGVIARAAERSGISRQMFHRLLRRHDLGEP